MAQKRTTPKNDPRDLLFRYGYTSATLQAKLTYRSEAAPIENLKQTFAIYPNLCNFNSAINN